MPNLELELTIDGELQKIIDHPGDADNEGKLGVLGNVLFALQSVGDDTLRLFERAKAAIAEAALAAARGPDWESVTAPTQEFHEIRF